MEVRDQTVLIGLKPDGMLGACRAVAMIHSKPKQFYLTLFSNHGIDYNHGLPGHLQTAAFGAKAALRICLTVISLKTPTISGPRHRLSGGCAKFLPGCCVHLLFPEFFSNIVYLDGVRNETNDKSQN